MRVSSDGYNLEKADRWIIGEQNLPSESLGARGRDERQKLIIRNAQDKL